MIASLKVFDTPRFRWFFAPILMTAMTIGPVLPFQGQQKDASPPVDGKASKDLCEPVGVSGDWRTGLVRMANGVTQDKFMFSRNIYLGCHGDDVYFEIFHYLSEKRARKEFDARIENTPRVIERRKKMDANGGVIAEMAVISVVAEGKKPTAMIVIVSQDLFRDVRSDSIEDILSIAKTIKP